MEGCDAVHVDHTGYVPVEALVEGECSVEGMLWCGGRGPHIAGGRLCKESGGQHCCCKRVARKSARRRREVHGRTSNVLTFDVSHKSGWLKALAPWKVACGAEAEGDILQVGG
jgi:hypothetical protein